MDRAAKFLLSLGLTMAIAAPLNGPGTADAQAAMVETPQIQRPVAPASRTAINGFDWLSKKSGVIRASYSADTGAVPQQIGRGSYICSPAGFGRKSTCYEN